MRASLARKFIRPKQLLQSKRNTCCRQAALPAAKQPAQHPAHDRSDKPRTGFAAACAEDLTPDFVRHLASDRRAGGACGGGDRLIPGGRGFAAACGARRLGVRLVACACRLGFRAIGGGRGGAGGEQFLRRLAIDGGVVFRADRIGRDQRRALVGGQRADAAGAPSGWSSDTSASPVFSSVIATATSSPGRARNVVAALRTAA